MSDGRLAILDDFGAIVITSPTAWGSAERRLVAGFARYQEAIGFGRDSLKWARKAEVLAIEKSARPDEKHE